MANRAGLRKVTKTVRGKKGSTKRSYWVKAGERNLAAFRKGPKMASAKMGAKIGFASGLLGAHRVRGASLASAAVNHTLAAHMRKKTKTHGRTLGGKIKNFLSSDVGHGVGHFAGAMAHEGIRAVAGRKNLFGKGKGGLG